MISKNRFGQFALTFSFLIATPAMAADFTSGVNTKDFPKGNTVAVSTYARKSGEFSTQLSVRVRECTGVNFRYDGVAGERFRGREGSPSCGDEAHVRHLLRDKPELLQTLLPESIRPVMSDAKVDRVTPEQNTCAISQIREVNKLLSKDNTRRTRNVEILRSFKVSKLSLEMIDDRDGKENAAPLDMAIAEDSGLRLSFGRDGSGQCRTVTALQMQEQLDKWELDYLEHSRRTIAELNQLIDNVNAPPPLTGTLMVSENDEKVLPAERRPAVQMDFATSKAGTAR